MKDLALSNSKEVMTSLQIAEITGKRYDHVMRDIRTLLEQGVSAPNFGEGSYIAESNFGEGYYIMGTSLCRLNIYIILIGKENLHRGNYPYVKSRASRGKNSGN